MSFGSAGGAIVSKASISDMRASRFLTGQRCLVEFHGEPGWAHERVELLAVYQYVRGVPTQVIVLTLDGERNVESSAQYVRRCELDHRHVVYFAGWATKYRAVRFARF